MSTLKKRCFLHLMDREVCASIRALAPLRGSSPKELLAQLTCSEYLQMIERLKNPPAAEKSAVD